MIFILTAEAPMEYRVFRRLFFGLEEEILRTEEIGGELKFQLECSADDVRYYSRYVGERVFVYCPGDGEDWILSGVSFEAEGKGKGLLGISLCWGLTRDEEIRGVEL